MTHPTDQDPRHVFDRAQIRKNRTRAHKHLKDHGFLFDWAGRQLLDRLSIVKRGFPAALQIGTRHSDDFAERLKDEGGIADLYQMDITRAPIIAEEDALPFAGHSLDLIISALNFHTVNDLPGALVQMRRALKPDGMLLAAMMGGETLTELRDCLMRAELELTGGVSPRVAPFADKQDMGALMQRAGYALPVVDSEHLHVSYKNIFALMKDLRLMGEGNAITARNKAIPPRALFIRAAEIYQSMYADDKADTAGRITASFEIIFLIGWAPHDSQQKPMAPGSARNRLADALEANEIKVKE